MSDDNRLRQLFGSLSDEQRDQIFKQIRVEAEALLHDEIEYQRARQPADTAKQRIVIISQTLGTAARQAALVMAELGGVVSVAADALAMLPGGRIGGDPLGLPRDLVIMDEANIFDECPGDPRPAVARPVAPVYHSPQLLRLDANSRKYQSTHKNWRKFAGSHHKKKKIIKGR